MAESSELKCPLCHASNPLHFHSDKRRQYYRCSTCKLVFVPPFQHLSLQEQKAVYDLHRNTPFDDGYRRFLSRLFEPLKDRLKKGASGLDYGCGPGPALARMFIENGHPMALFDPIYADNPDVLHGQYDFITCTEVVEHFADPGQELRRLFSLLKPGGVLGIMTKQVRSPQAFSQWHYKNDPTHVCFFSRETFLWLARRYHWHPEFFGNDVILLIR